MAQEALKYILDSSKPSSKTPTYPGVTFDNSLKTIKNIGTAFGVISTGALVAKQVIDKLNNDTRRKALIEDLSNNDPLLRQVDKKQLLEWYATIYHYGPKVSLDKTTVRELLQSFSRFGKVDMQSIKLIADTEKALTDADDKSGGLTSGWGSFLR